jgi:preprotein translocase subunit SecY
MVKIRGTGRSGGRHGAGARLLEVREGEDRGRRRERSRYWSDEMLKALGNAWRVPELRRKLMFTAVIITLYRLGCFVPLPGVNREALGQGLDTGGNAITGLFGVFTGGAFNNLSVFALGIMPYITASIVMQLMTVAVPRLQELAKEGETGQQKITQYTRFFTLALALVQSLAMLLFFRSGQFPGVMTEATVIDSYLIVITLTAGTMLIMWLGGHLQRGSATASRYHLGGDPLASASAVSPSGERKLLNIVSWALAVLIIAGIVFVTRGSAGSRSPTPRGRSAPE